MAALVATVWAQDEKKEEEPKKEEPKKVEHVLYPFEVTWGGQKAVMQEGNMLFAVVAKPVKPDALLALEEKSAMLIVNAFPCKEDGTVLETQTAAVIFTKDAKEVKMNATIDKKPLKPGTYLMNIVAHNKTSRVVFTVGAPGKIKMPDISKILDFLKGKNK